MKSVDYDKMDGFTMTERRRNAHRPYFTTTGLLQVRQKNTRDPQGWRVSFESVLLFSFSFSSYFEFTAIGSRPFLGVEAVNNGAHPSVLGIRAKAMRVYFFCCWRWIWEGWKKNKKNQTLRRKINGAPPFPGPCARKKTNRISHPCGKRKRLAWNVKENSVKTQSTTRKLSVQRMGHLVASSNELITVIIENNHFTISRSSLVPKNFK